jgi:hypothetical protein
LPKEYEFDFGIPFLKMLYWHFKWTDITYSVPDLDIQDVKILLTRGYDIPLIKIDLPVLKSWEINAH